MTLNFQLDSYQYFVNKKFRKMVFRITFKDTLKTGRFLKTKNKKVYEVMFFDM